MRPKRWLKERIFSWEIDGLQPDNYTIAIDLPNTQFAHPYKLEKSDFTSVALLERNFRVDWNGTIEGKVRDAAGRPANAHLLLLNPDGTDSQQFYGRGDTMNDGSFHIGPISRGQFKLMVNPYGPNDNSPYPPMYYPSAETPNDAHIFRIGDGQYIKNIDIVLRRLPSKKINVRVTSPDGHVIEGAWIHVAYERTRFFELLDTAPAVTQTDSKGEARFSVFGKSRIRIYAEEFKDNFKDSLSSTRRSSMPAEFEADKTPDKLELVLNQRDLPGTGVH